MNVVRKSVAAQSAVLQSYEQENESSESDYTMQAFNILAAENDDPSVRQAIYDVDRMLEIDPELTAAIIQRKAAELEMMLSQS